MVPPLAHPLLSALLLLGVWSVAGRSLEDIPSNVSPSNISPSSASPSSAFPSSASPSSGFPSNASPSSGFPRRSKPSKESNSAENFVRPLENMADRLLKSETVGVVDSITAEAIGAFTRLVDGAGLAMVDIIDNLPRTIDTVATTVDGVVRTVDQLGRDVAVIVTAPARVMLTGLNPNSTRAFRAERRSGERRSKSGDRRTSPTERLIERLRERRERRREILRNYFNIDDPYRAHPNDNVITERATAASEEGTTISHSSVPRKPRHGTVPAPNGGLRSLLNIFRPPMNRSDGTERVNAANSIARALGQSLFASQATLRQLEQSSASKERGAAAKPESQERPLSVFERNFEASKTQASINRLEKEVGSFLGRLLGTIYRNADPIDDSLSKGIRQVLGSPPREDNPQTPTGGAHSPAEGASSPAPTTTRRPFRFRLSFDDLDPAPARNAALTGP